MREKYRERAAYGFVAAPNDVLTVAALATIVVAVVSAPAVVVAAVVVVGVAIAAAIVIVAALAAAPNELNDDAVGIAIGSTIPARVAPSFKPHKNAATLKNILAVAVVSLYKCLEPARQLFCEDQTTQPSKLRFTARLIARRCDH